MDIIKQQICQRFCLIIDSEEGMNNNAVNN